MNTIIAKWTTTEEARNTIGIKESFDHPFLQSTGYFFGEFMCLLVYFLFRLILKLHTFCSDPDDEAVKIVERRREIREVTLIDNNVEVIDVEEGGLEEDEHERSDHSTPMRPVRRPQFNTKIEEIEDEEDSDFDRISSTASTDSGKFTQIAVFH